MPSLTWTTLFVACATAGLPSSGVAEDSAGNRTLAAAARSVQAESALSADLRCRINAFGHELAGQGSYQQLGKGPEKLLKLDLKIGVAGQAITRQEICGPTYYYIRRQSPLAPVSLGRVNLRQVRLAIARAPAEVATNPTDVWILLGGLPKLLESLQRDFEFSDPRPDELQFAGVDGGPIQQMPVMVLRGRWKTDRLAQLRQTDKGAGKDQVEQLPDEVEIVLSREDQTPPLFPYRLTYLKKNGRPGQGGAGERKGESPAEPLLTLELFNVHRKGNLDPRDFDYQLGEQEVADLTQSYLQRLGLTKSR